MRLKIATFMFVLGLSLNVQAQDNVMVDLSVLNGLSSSYVAPSEPMFPVLPKQPVRTNQKAKEVVARSKVVKAIKKEETVQPVEKKPIEKKPVEKETVTKEISAEENIVVVDVEPVAPVVANKEEDRKIAEPQEEKRVAAPAEPVTVKETLPVLPVVAQIPEEQKEIAPIEQKREVISEPEEKPEEKTEEPQQEKQEPVQNVVVSKVIVFESGISDLTPEQMAQIDNIIGRFSDTSTNKIAIYSYNVDDGVDTFRKKRISLNRAIAVRSYLLKQGYKNFSIKVININSDSDKANTVELEEI